jgi:hypothetical protein
VLLSLLAYSLEGVGTRGILSAIVGKSDYEKGKICDIPVIVGKSDYY